MPQLTIDLDLLGLPVADGDGWVQAVDSLGNPIPIAATNAGTLVFGSRALDFNTSGVATITLPSTDDLEPAGVRYLVFITRADIVTQPVAIGPFVFTADASLDEVAELPPADLVAAFNAVVTAAEAVLAGIGPIEPLAAQVSGYTDHGNISGAVTFTGPTGSHWFTATGPTTITLEGYSEPDVVTLICFSGAADVTVNDLPDLELIDGTAWSAQLARGVWVTGGGGGTPSTPDTTPPSPVTDLVATGGSEQVVGTWTAANDPESTVRYYWRVWATSGGGTGAWTMTTGTTFTKTGLPAGNYTAEVYSSSPGGNTTPDTDTATVTAPPAPLTETFTRADGTSMSGVTSTTGGYVWDADTENVSMFSAQSAPGSVTGGKYVRASGSQAIASTFIASNCSLTADYDVSAGGASKAAFSIAGTSGSNAINVIVNRAWNAARLYLDSGAHAAEASAPPTTGTIEVRYSSTTVTVKINGATVITQNSVNRTGLLVGLGAADGASIDNVTVTAL